ncbi:hypothetical protein [Pedobacter sp. MW01-1-1]|uniref:hypothetical protein n=1 Tax=Pedobacter sp. MW01-1-1 TaxID=3383027 RepID=UPI003FF007AE
MKKITLKPLLFVLFCIISSANAQVKKTTTTAKPSTQAIAPPKNLASDIFRSGTEQAYKILSNELKVMGVTIESLSENTIHENPKNGEKIGKLLQTQTKLICTKGIELDIFSNPADQVVQFNCSISNVSLTTKTNLERILGHTKWPLLNKSAQNTLYSNSNLMVVINDYSDNEKKTSFSQYLCFTGIDKSPLIGTVPPFNADSLSVHKSAIETGMSIIQTLKNQGIRLLCKTPTKIYPEYSEDEASKVRIYTTEYYFSGGGSVTVTSDSRKKLTKLDFLFSDPLVYTKFKKTFHFSEWTNEGEGEEEDETIYRKNHLEGAVNDKYKYISVNIETHISDVNTRLANSAPIDAASLINNYYTMDKAALKTYLDANYATIAFVNWTTRQLFYNEKADPYDFFFKSPSDSLCYACYEYKLGENWSRIVYFSTPDKAYYESMKNDLLKLANDANSKVIVNYSDKLTDKSKMYFITLFSKEQEAINAENKRRKEEALAAQQKREQEEAAERARQKAAKSAADIQTLGNILLQGIQQMKPKGNN